MRYSLRRLLDDPSAADWGFYYVLLRRDSDRAPLLIGAGGFKGAPDEHGLPSLAPSIGVLEKAGFRFAGAGHDPHAPAGEEVIRYELSRAEFERRS